MQGHAAASREREEPWPQTMTALIYEGPRLMRGMALPIPEPGPGEVLVKVAAVGICGSELEGYLGLSSIRRPPLVMGHEFSDTVVAVGATPSENLEGITVGLRVGVNPIISCGLCTQCVAGRPQRCRDQQLIGAHRAGAFADFVVVPSTALFPIPAEVSTIAAALIEPVAVAVHAVSLAEIHDRCAVGVWGAGMIGLCITHVARAAGARCVITVDTNSARLAAASAFGATHTIDASSQDAAEAIAAITGSVDVAFDAVGRTATRQTALACLGSGGMMVLTGLHDPLSTIACNTLIRSEQIIRGAYAYTPSDIETSLALLAHLPLDHDPPWLAVFPLSQGPSAFGMLIDAPGGISKAILVPGNTKDPSRSMA